MSTSAILTQGFGSFGNVNLLPVLGFGASTPEPIIATDTHDGLDAGHYKRYRKKIERLAKLADDYNRSKYVDQAVKAAEIVEELQISSPVIEQIAVAVTAERALPVIDYVALQAEFLRVKKYLDDLIELYEEGEDELALMMMI